MRVKPGVQGNRGETGAVRSVARAVGIARLLSLTALSMLSTAALAQEITLRWADVVPASHPSAQMIERIAADVKAKSGGRIVVQGFPGGQLGSSRDTIEAVANGTQQLVTEGAANFGAWVPSIGVIESPYVWRDADHLVKAMAGPVGRELSDELVAKRGMRILGTTYYGTRHLTTSNKAVKTPADLAGFKLRVPENEVFRAMAEAWGAKPTPMNFGELYLALKQGVVDGQENPLPTIKSGKFDEVQKFLVLTGHIITPRLVVVNEAFWKGLKPADQQILQQAIDAGIAWQNAELVRQEKELVDTFRTAGMTVVPVDIEAFRKPVVGALTAKFEGKWGKGTYEKLQAIR